jgi:Uma2 family endonuclease
MSALPQLKYSVEEYIELDKNSEGRYEYFDGVVVELTGANLSHSRIVRNLIRNLENQLDGSDCEVLPADMRLKVPAAFPYRYPDVVVVCGEPVIEELQGLDLLVNPLLIIEVLSPTTEALIAG